MVGCVCRAAAVCVLLSGCWLSGGARAQDAAPRLRGLVVLTDAGALSSDAADSIDLSQVPLIDAPDSRVALAGFIGRPIDGALLQDLRAAIVERYRAMGHPFLDVGFPQQDVTSGTLQAVVTEFRIGQLRVEGNDWFSEWQIRQRSGLEVGQTIDNAALSDRMTQLNAGPFLQVAPEFKAGVAPGTTDVVLRAKDHLPLQFTAGYDNTGGPTTGWDRWTLGATWGNAFLLGHTLTYQFGSSTDFWEDRSSTNGKEANPSFTSHTATWIAPLPWGHSLTLTGNHTQQSPDLGPDLGSVGVTESVGLQYGVPLGGLTIGRMTLGGTQDLAFGYDYKRSNNDLSFGGTSVNHSFTEISQFSLHYTLTVPDGWGQTTVQNIMVYSPGGMTSLNTDAAFQPNAAGQTGTVGAHARYGYDRLTMTRLVPLPRDFGVTVRLSGQFADQTLLPSEQLSIAGSDAVRGYAEGAITGSSGMVTSIEFGGPKFSPSGLVGSERGDSAQLHVFWDYGQGWNRTPSTADPANVHTSSVGFGGRYLVADNLSMRLEQGWELFRSTRQGAHGAFAHFSLSLTW